MSITLRDYQQECVDAVEDGVTRAVRKQLAVLPTGGGKTIIFSEIARRRSDRPVLILAHRDELRGKTVVSYCTGGIRCEKAALFMADAGIERVVQLDGGILKYFEDAGGAHFDGNCFVFDERRTVGADLCPAGPDAASVAQPAASTA